jgi:hypothetical protein
MSRIVIDFESDLYQLQTSNFSKKFIYNNLFFINLETQENIIINSLDKLNVISDSKHFCIFTFNFIGYIEILRYLKNKFNLNFIDFSLNCFWIMLVKDDSYCEKINTDLNTLIVEDEINKQELDLTINLEKEFNDFNKEINNYKKSVFLKSLVEVKKQKEKLHEYYLNLTQAYDDNKQNINLINKLDLGDIPILLKGEQDILDEINVLISEKQKYDYDLEVKKKEHQYLSVDINDKHSKLEKIRMEYDEYTLKLAIKEKEYKNRNIAIFLHIDNHSLWDNINSFLINLNDLEIEVDLYINIVRNPDDHSNISKLNNDINKLTFFENIYFTESDKKGLDIGGFLKSYYTMLTMDIKYKSILKIHTKTNNKWFFALIYSLIGSKNIIQNNLRMINKKSVGMIGYTKLDILEYLSKENDNYRYLGEHLNYFNIEINENNYFIPGGIFWIKANILSKYFTKQKLDDIYKNINSYKKEEMVDSFERLFGIFVSSQGKSIYCLD